MQIKLKSCQLAAVIATCWVALVVDFALWWLFSTALGHHAGSSVQTAIDALVDHTFHNLTNDHIDNVVLIHVSFP